MLSYSRQKAQRIAETCAFLLCLVVTSVSVSTNDALRGAVVCIGMTVIQPGDTAPGASCGVAPYITDEDTVLSVPVSQGLIPDGNPTLTATLTGSPSHGSIVIDSDGSFVYEPDEQYFGVDDFSYSIFDGFASSLYTKTITITSVNDAPVGVMDAYTVTAGTTTTISALQGVLINDTDIEDDLLTAVLVSAPSGILSLASHGGFTYTPLAGVASDSFTYRASDGSDESTTTTVTLTIQGVIPAVVAAPGEAVESGGYRGSCSRGRAGSECGNSEQLHGARSTAAERARLRRLRMVREKKPPLIIRKTFRDRIFPESVLRKPIRRSARVRIGSGITILPTLAPQPALLERSQSLMPPSRLMASLLMDFGDDAWTPTEQAEVTLWLLGVLWSGILTYVCMRSMRRSHLLRLLTQ